MPLQLLLQRRHYLHRPDRGSPDQSVNKNLEGVQLRHPDRPLAILYLLDFSSSLVSPWHLASPLLKSDMKSDLDLEMEPSSSPGIYCSTHRLESLNPIVHQPRYQLPESGTILSPSWRKRHGTHELLSSIVSVSLHVANLHSAPTSPICLSHIESWHATYQFAICGQHPVLGRSPVSSAPANKNHSHHSHAL